MATRARADRRAKWAAGLAAAAVFALGSPAARGESPRRVLFIGNSLTEFNDLPAMVEAFGAADVGGAAASGGGSRLECRAVTAPGFSLEDHWDRSDARAAIGRGGWDFVVLQQGPSASPEGRASLLRDARRFAELIRKAGATPALYAVWPVAARRLDFDVVAASYAQAAREAKGVLLPVGTAWQSAWKRDPGLAFYAWDGLHPTPAASYLAALVIYQGLSGRSPVGLPAALELGNGTRVEIPTREARVLQEAAAEASRFAGEVPQKTIVTPAPR
jgi:hypothetical protein